MMEYSAIENILIDIITDIQDFRHKASLVPDLATMSEIRCRLQERMLEGLRSLYRKGRLEFHRDVNGNELFGLKDE